MKKILHQGGGGLSPNVKTQDSFQETDDFLLKLMNLIIFKNELNFYSLMDTKISTNFDKLL